MLTVAFLLTASAPNNQKVAALAFKSRKKKSPMVNGIDVPGNRSHRACRLKRGSVGMALPPRSPSGKSLLVKSAVECNG
jgi:hypothetical protein